MDYHPAFRYTLPHQCDSHLLSLLSPSGQRLASTGKNGPVIITRIPEGRPCMTIELDDAPRVTCLGWMTDSNILIGDDLGGVMQVNVTRNPVPCIRSLPAISYISTRRNRPVKAIAFDVRRCLLVIALDSEVQIWGFFIVDNIKQEWKIIDIVKCVHNGREQQVAAVNFFGVHCHLLVTTDHGFIIWADKYNSPTYLERDVYNIPLIEQCVVSHDNKTLAASGQDRTIWIWPLSDTNPVMDQQRTFVIPNPHNQVATTNSAPIAFLDEFVITTDSSDKVYVISLDAEPLFTFSTGVIHSIRSLWAENSTLSIVAMGPTRTTMVIGYTKDETTHNQVIAQGREQDQNA
ncbi:hypothetical protein FRC06_006904 [Ceratobasidium sp. 370]|nr:hypothetical protein FRC06_006904 [Ceratobasidium sp. 370]